MTRRSPAIVPMPSGRAARIGVGPRIGARRCLSRFSRGLIGLSAILATTLPAQTGPFEALRAMDMRVAMVAARLLAANVALCRTTRPDFGLMLHAIDQYPPAIQAEARAAFRFEKAVSVALVVPGGVAERAGVQADDGLVAIAGTPVGPPETSEAGASTRTRDRALDRLAAMPPQRPVSLTVVRNGIVRAVRVTPPPVCAADVELATDRGANAVADDATIQIGIDLVARIDDDGLAVVLAHELAHVILDHRRRLNAAGVRRGLAAEFGRNRRLIRATEDEADRLSAYLLANAGYDVAAAADFWLRKGAGLDGGPFRSRTHSGSATRSRMLRAEIPAIAASTARPVRPGLLDQRDRPLN